MLTSTRQVAVYGDRPAVYTVKSVSKALRSGDEVPVSAVKEALGRTKEAVLVNATVAFASAGGLGAMAATGEALASPYPVIVTAILGIGTAIFAAIAAHANSVRKAFLQKLERND